MESKFKVGDGVEVVNYGDIIHCNELLWMSEANMSEKLNEASGRYIFLGDESAYENLDSIPDKYKTIEETGVVVIRRDDNWVTIDMNPEYIGEKGTVVDVYIPKDGRKAEYALSGTTKSAWFYEDQLELVNK